MIERKQLALENIIANHYHLSVMKCVQIPQSETCKGVPMHMMAASQLRR